MNKKTFIQKNNGDKLEASEWNELTSYTNEIVDAVNQSANNNSGSSSGNTSGGSMLPNIYINSKGNFNIETSAAIGNTSKGKINIEAMDDIQLKPGDDIILYSHHRAIDKQDEVAVKVTDGDDIPVKLQLNASEMLLTTKDKTGANADVFDVTVNSAANNRGYLKVRAQAIDLRCEKHGGIALQPKGYDGSGNMNKIKFEHGGGDGLEFGTFNTEKTSIFTDEYRFNKDGVWKMATRQKVASDKTISNEGAVPAGKPNTADYKYVKQADDFYDIIADDDAVATTRDIIKTAAALNGNSNIHTHITRKGNLEIESVDKWDAFESEDITYTQIGIVSIDGTTKITKIANPSEPMTFSDLLDTCFGTSYAIIDDEGGSINIADVNNYDGIEIVYNILNGVNEDTMEYFKVTKVPAPSINIESDSDIKIAAAGSLKLGGELDFGSTFNFGETDGGIEVQYKYTKKAKVKDCGVVNVVAINNHASNNLTVEGEIIAPGETKVIASCSLLDIIKLTNYMKQNSQGPWTSE